MNERKTIYSEQVKMSFTRVIDKWVHPLVLTNSLTDVSLIVNKNMKYWIAMSPIITFTVSI